MRQSRLHKKHLQAVFVVLMLSCLPSGLKAASPFPNIQAPPLPPPTGNVMNVSTEAQLQTAVANLQSNTTIVIAPGTYNLTNTLWFNRGTINVSLRGATNSHDDVVLRGHGMANANYGNVPHGIFIGNAQNVLIANLTIRDVYFHPIQLDPGSGAQAPRFYSLRLVNAGEQFIKSSSSASGLGVHNGVVEYTIMEYEDRARSDYTNGVDVHGGANWIIRNNLFRNIRAPLTFGQAGPAILMWNRSRDTIAENNTFVNCERGIAFGLDISRTDDHRGGIVRNNFLYRAASERGDVGISAWNSAGTQILNNTVILSGTYQHAIEYRFPATTNVEVRNNLTDATIQARDGATGVVANNVTNAQTSWFINSASGDLHLVARPVSVTDRATPHPNVTKDYDGQNRP